MRRSPLVGPVVIVVAILWLGFGASMIGASGVPGVMVGIIGALGVGIGARMTDLARKDRQTRRRPPPPDYPRRRDQRGR